MMPTILAVNSGSSSIKVTIYGVDENRCLGTALHHLVAEVRGEAIRLHVSDANTKATRELSYPLGKGDMHQALFNAAVHWLDEQGEPDPIAIGHRVAHGGQDYSAPVVVDDAVLLALDKLVPLAPLHQPYCLGGIRALSRHFPHVPQFASFDTAFHASMPVVETRYALPRSMEARGVRRYGFHGLSYTYIAGVLPRYVGERADGRVVVAHLGSGASLCAMHGRRSVATTMGFTALDGLVMGTRCGALDPGVVIYMAQEMGLTQDQIVDVLYHQSGLLGVSGISSDMRTLSASSEPYAQDAVELFCYRVNRELGAMVAALGGIETLVFTGGIGEHAVDIRARVAGLASWLGLSVDAAANEAGKVLISTPDSKVSVLMIPTDEESVIAQAALNALLIRPANSVMRRI
jgi:acetate kinase